MSEKRDRIHSLFEQVDDERREEVLRGIMRSDYAEEFMRVLRDDQVHKWQTAQASKDNDERVRHLGGAEVIEQLMHDLLATAE